jgi:hypothetical protein
MKRNEQNTPTHTAEPASPQTEMLKQIAFHGVLIMFAALLIAGVLKAF